MKTFILIILIVFTLSTNAQKFYKDKSAALAAVTEKGYKYNIDQKKSNIYWYMRYDSYGESIVQLTFEGNILRKAVIIHLDPNQTLYRLKDIFAKTTSSESLTFDPISNGYGKGEASNTPYYSGKARYECNNNYSSKDYLFTFMPLD